VRQLQRAKRGARAITVAASRALLSALFAPALGCRLTGRARREERSAVQGSCASIVAQNVTALHWRLQFSVPALYGGASFETCA